MAFMAFASELFICKKKKNNNNKIK